MQDSVLLLATKNLREAIESASQPEELEEEDIIFL